METETGREAYTRESLWRLTRRAEYGARNLPIDDPTRADVMRAYATGRLAAGLEVTVNDVAINDISEFDANYNPASVSRGW